MLVSHSFLLSGEASPAVGRTTLGEIAVAVFFGISGFLVTKSWALDPHLTRYVVKRALRIFPALIAVLTLSALILGPLATTWSVAAYVTEPQTWGYVVRNLAMRDAYGLPGVFAGNPYPGEVNGSLWTLAHELHAYMTVALLGLAGIVTRRRWMLVAWGVVIVLALTVPHGLDLFGHPVLLLAFAIGAALYVWREPVPWSAWIAVALLGAWVLTSAYEVGDYAASVALPYTIILLAHRAPRAWGRLASRGDISYGVYLWAFPVQQTIAHLWPSVPAAQMVVLSFAVTLPLAVASWTLVERPALNLKTRLVSRRPFAAGAAARDALPLTGIRGPGLWGGSRPAPKGPTATSR